MSISSTDPANELYGISYGELNTDNKNSRQITEEMNLQDEWYTEAETMTLDRLHDFVSGLDNNYSHDYGTICHAIVASMLACGNAMDSGKNGGISGFQAGAIFWEFTRRWKHLDGPAALIAYENLLYPQYEYQFNSISQDTFDWIKEEAEKNLAVDDKGNEHMRNHWQSIVNGKVPFGLKIKDDE